MALRGQDEALGDVVLIFERAGDVRTAPQPTGETLTYACDGGAFTVRTKTGPGEIALWLPERFGNRYFVLGQVRAASGAKYQDGDTLLWTQGDGARLEVNGRVQRLPARALTASATARAAGGDTGGSPK